MNDIRIIAEIWNLRDVRRRWKRLDRERKLQVLRIVAGECSPKRIREAVAAVMEGKLIQEGH